MPNTPTLVWSEVPVSDLDRAVKFYNTVFGWKMEIDSSGHEPMAFFGGEPDGGGHLYSGVPGDGNGPTVHIAIPDRLEDAVQRAWEAGGTVRGLPVKIPPGRFAYVQDPDGNPIGLFEPAAA